jgi:hypothetical protein
MVQQWDAQCGRAISAMPEILKAGAMGMIIEQMIEQRAASTFTTRGKGATGNGVKGDGLKGLLARYAPHRNYSTARRFIDIAKSVQDQFALPAKIRKSLGFAGLATADAGKLSDKERKLQQDLFAFIDGTSQRSWLDGFKAKNTIGGDTRKPCPHCGKPVAGGALECPHCHAELEKYDPDAPVEQARSLILKPFKKLLGFWEEQEQGVALWAYLTRPEKEEILGALIDLQRDLKESLKAPDAPEARSQSPQPSGARQLPQAARRARPGGLVK